MPLVTRNVFIDTEFFVKANLDFNSRTIKSFEELCGNQELMHFTSTIVVHEVKRKIVEHIREAIKGINNFRRKAAVLKEYDDEAIKNLFVEINEADLEEKALSAFDSFIENSSASVIDMSGVDGNEVIEMYFNQRAPFSSRKPNEFRDAFSLLAIRYAVNAGQKIYIVSSDPDHVAFCEENDDFVSIDTLSALLDTYNKHNNQRAQFVGRFLDNRKDDIKAAIKRELEHADAYNVSSWEDAELTSFEVIEVEDFEPQIVHLDDDSCIISFTVDVKLSANVSGPDYANGFYDREDGTIYTFDNVERKDEEEKTFSVDLELLFEAGEDGFINDEFNVLIEGLGRGIEFSVEENPWEDPRM